uniref:Uncharacterized protein n=1 Tax=Arundo donax TaxID=35708 RepID=A0A0A9EVU7_ARUDO
MLCHCWNLHRCRHSGSCSC